MRFDEEAGSSSNVLKIPTFPREDTPLLIKPDQTHLSSQFKTFANVFIAAVGAGVLGLPYTFKKTGWVMGSLMLMFVSLLIYFCMMKLVQTRRKLETLQGFSKISSFGDLGFAACGPIGRICVDVMIVLTQAGFCVSYLIFISNSLANVFNHQQSAKRLDLFSPKSLYLWGCFPFQLGLNSIPSLTHLAPLSIFADVVQLGAMGVVMVKDLMMLMIQKVPTLKAFGGFSVFFYGVGVCVYCFEILGMVLPLESETRDKGKFGRVLGWCMAFISLLYASFGVLGYSAFGEETRDIITTNFGSGLVSTLVQLGLSVNLFFTLPIMMNPVYEVVERWCCGSNYCWWMRWVVVLVVSLVALWVPNFADFLSLVGSSVCCALGFVFPALFHLLVFKDELSWNGFVLDSVIVVFGVVIGVAGTLSSLLEIFGSKS